MVCHLIIFSLLPPPLLIFSSPHEGKLRLDSPVIIPFHWEDNVTVADGELVDESMSCVAFRRRIVKFLPVVTTRAELFGSDDE